MDNTRLIERAHELAKVFPDSSLSATVKALLEALETAEAERDSAWADGYNKAISQRLAASGSIGGNF